MTTRNLPATISNTLPVAHAKLRNTRLGHGLSSKRVALVEAMVYEGLSRQDAAKKVQMTDRAARYALSNSYCMAAYQRCLQILRESEKPRAIHKLAKLRDQVKSLKVSLEASKFLAVDDHGGPTIQIGLAVNVAPGYICDISEHAEAARRILRENGVGLKTIEKSRNP